MRAALLAALLGLAAAPAPALAQADAPQGGDARCAPVLDERPADDAFLTEQQLRDAFTGRDLEGCYPDGSLWAERTAPDGALYDNLQDGLHVGEWWVAGNRLCYFYPATQPSRDDAACWEVIRRDGVYYFFFPGTHEIGGVSFVGALMS